MKKKETSILEKRHLIISTFKKAKKKTYDFIVKAGPKFETVVFMFCKSMFEEERFPESLKKKLRMLMICKGGMERKARIVAK